MSEEMIKNLIARLNHNCSNACLNDTSSCICTVNDIKDLIYLYTKEKEKNKSISIQYEKIVDKLEEQEKNKKIEDKIKEILKKDRDCMSLGYYSAYIGLIDDIQRLLYKE